MKTYSREYSSCNNDMDEVKSKQTEVNLKLESGNPCDVENELYRCQDLKWINRIYASYGKHAVLTVDDNITFVDGNNNQLGPSVVSKTLRDYFLNFCNHKLKSKNKACLITRPNMPDNIPNVVMHHKKHKTVKFSKQAELSDYKPLEVVYPAGISNPFWYQLLNIPSILFKIENLMTFYDLKSYLRDGSRVVRNNNINGDTKTCIMIEKIGICIDFELIQEALSSSSAGMGTSNKELQLFGDAILDFCTLLNLMINYPNEKMSRWITVFPDVVSNENLMRCGGHNINMYNNNYNINNYNNNNNDFNLSEYGAFKEFSWQCWHPPLFYPRINSFHLNQNVGKEPFAGNVESLIGACFLTHCSPNLLKYNNINRNYNLQNNQEKKPGVYVYQHHEHDDQDDNVDNAERHLSDGEESESSGSDMDLCTDDDGGDGDGDGDGDEVVSKHGRIPSDAIVTPRSVIDQSTNADQKVGVERGGSTPVEQAFTQCFQLLDFLGVWDHCNIKNSKYQFDMTLDIGIGIIALENKYKDTIRSRIRTLTTLIGYDFDCNGKFDGDCDKSGHGVYKFSERTLGFAMILAVIDKAKESRKPSPDILYDEINQSYISLKRISFSKFEFIGDKFLKLYVTYVLFAYFKQEAKNSIDEEDNNINNEHDNKEAEEDIISYNIGLKMRCTKRLNNEITNERKKWISNKHLANQIAKYGIDKCIVWGPTYKRQTKSMADVFEALLGAIFWHSNWKLFRQYSFNNGVGIKEDVLLNFEPCIKFCEKFLGMSQWLDFKQFDWDDWKNTNNCRLPKFRPTLQEFIGTATYQ